MRITGITLLTLLAGFASAAAAQSSGAPGSPSSAPRVAPQPPAAASSAAVPSTGNPKRDTLLRFMRPVSINFTDTRVEDALKFIQEVTGADMEVLWADDRHSTGLDRETTFTLNFERGSVLSLLERILEKAAADATGRAGNTWQMTDSGAMQVGPKDRLNAFKRVQMYSIQDLLLEVPNYTNAPEFDLQSVLQSSQGGGGGQSPFRDTNTQGPARRSAEDKTNDIVSLITQLVEPEQWTENGGDGGSVRAYQGTLIINAPDYMHRQIDGYAWWPAQATRVSSVGGRRYVTLGVDTANSSLKGFSERDITAVAGGQLINSNPTRGPGGTQQPRPAQPAQPAQTGPK